MNKSTIRSCVIVLGMHRSGTSALTKKIIDMGFALPSEAMPAHDVDNPNGYWEPKKLVQINNYFLKSLGFSWNSVDPVPHKAFRGNTARQAIDDIKILLSDAFLMNGQLVVKDPRLCRLLPLLLTALQELGSQVAIVFIVRKPDAVFQSLAKRQDTPEIAAAAITSRAHVDLMWLRHNIEAEMHSRDLPRICFSYEAWLAKPEKVNTELVDFLRAALPKIQLEPPIDSLTSPRHKAVSCRVINDVERLNEALYRLIADNTVGNECTALLNKVGELAAVGIPEDDEHIESQPPLCIRVPSYLKHISASVALDTSLYMTEHVKDISRAQYYPIIFISQAPTTRSHIYRVKNPVDALNQKGITSFWTTSEHLESRIELIKSARRIIIHRSEWSKSLSFIIEVCRNHNVPISYDLDDLIVDPEIIERGYLPFINNQGSVVLEQWLKKSANYYRALCLCDEVICSTKALAVHIESMGHYCRVISNGFSEENRLLSEYWRQHRSLLSDGVKRVGYASGTPTHDADFALIVEPLAKFLRSNPDWIFTLVGHLSIESLQSQVPERQIEIRRLVQPINLAYELARLDINLIPLQDNLFCNAKSPLKWYEAALCGTPSIASKNPTYKFYLESQAINAGLIASTADDWLHSLNELAASDSIRKTIADSARLFCEENLHSKDLCFKYIN